MDIYVLDSQFRRVQIIDVFESLIWTEKWQEIGDFELNVSSNQRNRSLLKTNTRLAINGSKRVMVVESVEDTTDSDGKDVLYVRGRSLESILESRVAKEFRVANSYQDHWVLNGRPKVIANAMFDHICRPPSALHVDDALPYLQPGSIFPEDTFILNIIGIRWIQQPDSLYNALRSICTEHNLGFRFGRNGDKSELYFDAYQGRNLSNAQTILPAVMFDVNTDDFLMTSEFSSIANLRTVAYVLRDGGDAYVNSPDGPKSGFNRKVLLVRATIDDDVTDTPLEVARLGREALKDRRFVSIVDGEISRESTFKYGIDYHIGDLVNLRNKDDEVFLKRVTEYIFVSDAMGDRGYPTLSEPYVLTS